MDKTLSLLQFHKATADDIALMAELSLAACKKKIYDRHDYPFDEAAQDEYLAERRERIQDDFLDEDFNAFIVRNKKKSDQACGVVSVFLPDDRGVGYIQDLYAVDGGMTGVASLKHAKDFLIKHGANSVQLQSNHDAVPFYERNGFRNVSADPYTYLMECRL